MDERLLHWLERSRALGFLGPGSVEDHVVHAQGFVDALEGVGPGTVVDLGSGGGVPGLVIALARPDLSVVLLDSMQKRCSFLVEAVDALEINAQVLEQRAELTGRGPLRGTAVAVTARSFGPPSATAECAAPLLEVGGILVVSEPPSGQDRWPSGGLAELGMVPDRRLDGPPAIQTMRQDVQCPDRYPRREGIPAKRPLF